MVENAIKQAMIEKKKNAWQKWVQETKIGRNWLFFHRQFLDQVVQIWQNYLLIHPSSFDKGQPSFFYLNSVLHDIIWCKNHKNTENKYSQSHDDKAQHWVNENLWRLYLQNQSLKAPHKINHTEDVLEALTQLHDHQVDILCIPQLLGEENFQDILTVAWQKLSVNGLLCIEQFNPLSVQYVLGQRLGLWASFNPQNADLGMQKMPASLLQNFAHQQGWASVYAKYHIYSLDVLMRHQKLNDAFLCDFDEKTRQNFKSQYSEKMGQRWFARFGLCYYLILQKKGVAEPLQKTSFRFNTQGSKAAASYPRNTFL